MKQFEIIEKLKVELKKCPHIKSAILYGSFARKKAVVNSDIDLAILVDFNFDIKYFIMILNRTLSEFLPIHILHVKLRNKIVVLFEETPRVEISLLSEIKDIEKNYKGSKIPEQLITNTILFDKTNSVKKYLLSLSKENHTNKILPEIIDELISKFIYEFESCSYHHFRSDGYKFYFFYNIALHVAIQLRYLASGKIDYYFLPKKFLINTITDENERKEIYKLSGSIYLREANEKKRNLIDFFLDTLKKLNYNNIEQISNLLEIIYKRDYFWNFRDIAKFNPIIKQGKIFRTSSLTHYQNDEHIISFLKKKNINTIIDLRADQEAENDPYNSKFISNFKYIRAPFDPWNQPEWFKRTQHYGTNTEIAYRFFVKACKKEVKKIFDTILESEEAVVIHCVAGKDRTGFIIILINLLIGTPYKNILNDYLASELDASEEKFKIYYENILEEGGIEKYLQSCGINESQINQLRKKLIRK